MHVIGLTGSLGTGKSTVAGMFAALGAKVIDADKTAHRLIRPGAPCFRKVVKLFGKEILKAGGIDRKKVSQRVFKDRKLLIKLNRVVHPAVRNAMLAEIARYRKTKRYAKVILDVPLLFETGMDKWVDQTIVVRSTRERQITRATRALGITEAEAKQRIRAQMPLQKKIRKADMIINNNGTINQSKKQVKKIWQKLQ